MFWLTNGLVTPGCAASAAEDSRTDGSGGDTGEPVPHTLSFEPASTLTSRPRELHTLTVMASPKAVYGVRFALLPDPDRAPNDASLDRTEALTDSEGIATVQLRAPSAPTTFRIRASVATAISTELAVSISETGFATLLVEPDYAGKREVTEWVASVRAGTSCASLTGIPPADGDLIARAPYGQSPAIDLVPQGPELAVTLRAGEFAGGCADVPGLTTAVSESVTVSVLDRPMQVQHTDLQVALAIAQPTAGWNASLQSAIDATVAAVLGESQDDVDALLDVMQFEAGAMASEFEIARVSGTWDTRVRDLFGADAASILRSKAALWMVDGATRLVQSESFLGHLTGTELTNSEASFELLRVAQLQPQAAGFAPLMLAKWSAEPGDTVLLGLTLYWLPSRLVTALANEQAKLDYAGATSAVDALSMHIGCEQIGATLTDPASDVAYAGCDLACATALCETAIGTIWQRAREALAKSPMSMQVTATGLGTVDTQARPVSFSGSWVGSFKTPTNEPSTVSGTLSGALPPPPD